MAEVEALSLVEVMACHSYLHAKTIPIDYGRHLPYKLH